MLWAMSSAERPHPGADMEGFVREQMAFVGLADADDRDDSPHGAARAQARGGDHDGALRPLPASFPRRRSSSWVKTASRISRGIERRKHSLGRWLRETSEVAMTHGFVYYLLAIALSHSHREYGPGGKIPSEFMVGAMSLAQTAIAGVLRERAGRSARGPRGRRRLEQAPPRAPERPPAGLPPAARARRAIDRPRPSRHSGRVTRPGTVGELRASGYTSKSVKQELRDNLVKRLKAGAPLFPGIVGYEDTVLPQIENAILSGQDIVFLGERGQAKTKIARLMVELLDDEVPALAGCETNDDPFAPISPGRAPADRRAGRPRADRVAPARPTATARSSRRPTSRSRTSSARWIRSRSPRGATSPTS